MSLDGIIQGKNPNIIYSERLSKESISTTAEKELIVDRDATEHATSNNRLARGVFNNGLSGISQLAQKLNETFQNISEGTKITENLNKRLESEGLSDTTSVSYDFASNSFTISNINENGETTEIKGLNEVDVTQLAFDFIGENIETQLNDKLESAGLEDSLTVTFNPQSNTFSFGSESDITGRNDLSGDEVTVLVNKAVEDFGQ